MKPRRSALLCIMLLFFLIGQLVCPPLALGADELKLNSPNGGETLKVGTVHKLTWHLDFPYDLSILTPGGGYTFYKLEYSTDSGATYQTITKVDSDIDSYDWTVANSVTTKARVKVSLIAAIKDFITQQYHFNTVITDISDSDFAISNTTTIPIIPVKPIKPLPLIPAPAAPSDLSAKASSATVVKLNWKDNSNNESEFKLERSASANNNFITIATLDANTVNYTDNSVSAATKYYYRIKASNLGGSSAYSNQVPVTTPALVIPDIPPIQPPLPPVTVKTVIKFYLGNTDFLVNEQLQTMDASPVSMDGRTMLPIKYVAQPLGATTAWDPATQKVTVTLGSNVIELWVGNNTARVNGQDKLIDPNNPVVKPLILPPGRTMLPLRFIGENLGCQVDWNPTQQEAKLTYPN